MTYQELNETYAWRMVMFWYERVIEKRFFAALPTYDLMALHANMNRRKNAKALTGVDFMHPFQVPERFKNANTNVARWSGNIIDAFEEALERNMVSNGLLAALDVNALRASGADLG